MKILICIEGNVLDPQNNFSEVGGSATKINKWIESGAEVEFLSAISKFTEVKKMNDKLKELGLAGLKIHAKHENEKQTDLIELIKPRVLIENKESFSEAKEIEQLKNEGMVLSLILLDKNIGLEVLPDGLEDLKFYGQEEAVEQTEE